MFFSGEPHDPDRSLDCYSASERVGELDDDIISKTGKPYTRDKECRDGIPGELKMENKVKREKTMAASRCR